MDKDGKLKIYRDLLEKNHISLEIYIENVLSMYPFEPLEPKNKAKVSSEEDSDDDLNESDSETSEEE